MQRWWCENTRAVAGATTYTLYSCNQSIIDLLLDWSLSLIESPHWLLSSSLTLAPLLSVCKIWHINPNRVFVFSYIIAKSGDNINILVIYCINFIRYLVVLIKKNFNFNYSNNIEKMTFVPGGTPWFYKENNSLKQIGLRGPIRQNQTFFNKKSIA